MAYRIGDKVYYPAGDVRYGFPDRSFRDTGRRVEIFGDSRPVLKNMENGGLVMVWTPLNSQWPVYQYIRTNLRSTG